MAGYTIQLNNRLIRAIQQADIKAAIRTANSIKDDVDADQTVPFLTGALNQSAFVNTSNVQNDGIQISYTAPYVGYQYYTPGLNHYTGQHSNATDHWLDPYLSNGTKKDFAADKYREHMVQELRRL